MAKLKIDLNFSLSRLDLVTKGLVNTKFLGSYASAFKGQGLEFADYRNYVQGVDDASQIDWKASKRVNNLLVKEYTEERNLEVVFLIDVSEKMLTGSIKKLKAEYIAELVSSFSYSMLQAGDAVGIILFSDSIINSVKPESGMQQFHNLTKKMTNTTIYEGFSDIDLALNYCLKSLNKGTLIILISDFIYPIKSDKSLKFVASNFDLINIMVRDRLDMELPKGVGEVLLQDPYSGETLLINPNNIGSEYARQTKQDVKKVKDLVEKNGSDFLFLRTDKSFVKPIIEFFKSREAKWR